MFDILINSFSQKIRLDDFRYLVKSDRQQQQFDFSRKLLIAQKLCENSKIRILLGYFLRP